MKKFVALFLNLVMFLVAFPEFADVSAYENSTQNALCNGTYKISSALNNNKVLDIVGGSTDSGANLHLWEENNSDAQKFEIKYEGFECYTIKAVCSGKMLDVACASPENGTNIQQYDKNNTDAQKWYIVPLSDGYYSIISKCNSLYMDVAGAMTTNGTNIYCWNDNHSKAQKFKFIKCSSLDNEPIDVVYKYIDLTDENLHRDGIKQIKKDYENEELRYSLRSVLENIPWVRKIFIIMPNDKVRFLKDYKDISDKIVYVRDKDLIGFDSASSITFEFNLWRMKEFGCSENFIYLNDDCFIGKPMKKSDFFYEENGKIVPYILYAAPIGYNQYEKINNYYKSLNYTHNNNQTCNNFHYQKLSSIMFLYKFFNRDIIAPKDDLDYFPHNAFGQSLNESKEIYDLVAKNYPYPNACLRSIYRHEKSLTYNTVYSFYFLNKYNRKINNFYGAYIDLANAQNANFNFKLFCINTSGDREYTDLDYINSKIAMMKLFPKRSIYEKPEISDGIYEISSALNENKVLDIDGESTDSGANLHLWDKNNSNAQKFEIKYQGFGCYTIKAVCSGKMLDVVNAGSQNGTNIQQHDKNNTDAQKWYIVPLSNGYYSIISKCNGLYMDVSEAMTSNGTNIHCWSSNSTKSQKFKLNNTTILTV